MIVPSNRLLFITGLTISPLAIIPAIPEAGILAAGSCFLLAMVLMIDIILGRNRYTSFKLVLPEMIHLSKDKPGEIPFRIHRQHGRVRRVRIGLMLPKGITSPTRDLAYELDREQDVFAGSWLCTALCRGSYRLEQFRLEVSSPFGFWALRKVVQTATEVRVYPNLVSERRNLAALFLNRGIYGMHVMRQVGKGRDFEHLRNYVSGDSFEDISWKATARRRHPVTKVYQLEKTQEVYVIVDGSRLSARQLQDRKQNSRTSGMIKGSSQTVLERFLTASLVLGLAAEQQGDLFGMMTFSDAVERFVKAGNGKTHFNRCRDALFTVEPRLVNPDFAELFSFIVGRLRRRALLIFLTSLDDFALAESFSKNINILARRHVVMVNIPKPAMALPMFSDKQVFQVDDLYRNLGGHLLWARLRETEKILRQKGVGFFMFENVSLCIQLIRQYLSIKQRQMI